MIKPLPPNPKISVITVSYNHAEFIRDTIESVLIQKYPNFEHIVVDGGSTDQTVEILKSYPHLLWTSERDRGQSDALNKGFARASGDIIAWINSDDWYAPDAFRVVAERLQHAPVCIGVTEEVGRKGEFRQRIPNHPRTFFDLLRYWVPYAWLAQPGVFFRRELLEQVRLADGSYIDEGFDVSMDYELWLRMARHHDFTEHINQTVAYFRVYGDNKTGADRPTGHRELGRAFRRHTTIVSGAERRLAFIIPVNAADQVFAQPVESIAKQSSTDFDMIFVDWSSDSATAKEIRETVGKVEDLCKVVGVRYVRSKAQNRLAACNDGVAAARTQLVAYVQPGDVVDADFVVNANNTFALDITGFALPIAHDKQTQELLYNVETNGLRYENIHRVHIPFPNFVARTVALREIGGFEKCEHEGLSIRMLMLKLACRGWHMNVLNELRITPEPRAVAEVAQRIAVSKGFLDAHVLCELDAYMAKDLLREIKVSHALAPAITPELAERARRVLSFAPPDWYRYGPASSADELMNATRQFPDFAPAWFYLGQKLRAAREEAAADRALGRFNEISAVFG